MSRVLGATVRRLAATMTMVLLAACSQGSPEEQARGFVAKAEAAIAEGRYDTAVIELKNAIQIAPNAAEPRLKLGRLHLERYRVEDAIKELSRALDNGADERDALAPLLTALLYANRPEEALKRIEDAGREAAGAVEVRHLEVESLIALGRLDEASAILDELPAEDPRTLARRARLAALRGDRTQALELAGRAAADRAADAQTLLTYAEMVGFGDQESTLKALQALERGLEIDPHSPLLRVNRATALTRLGRIAEAEAQIEDLLADGFVMLPALHLQSVIALQRQDFERAKALTDQILSARPRYMPSLFIGGIANTALGNDELAVTQLQRFVNDPTAPPAALKALATAQLRLGNADAAVAALQNPALEDDDLQRTGMLLSAALADGDYDEAKRLLGQVVGESPEDSRAALALAALQLMTGAREEARPILSELSQKADSASVDEKVKLAMLQIQAGDFDSALDIATSIQEEAPAQAVGFTIAGLAEIGRGNPDAAIVALETALLHRPGDPTASSILASVRQQQGRAEEAEALLRRALQDAPTDPRLLRAMVSAMLGSGDRAGAETLLRETVEDNPEAVEPAALLAQLLLEGGWPDEAFVVAEQAARYSPENPALLRLMGLAQEAMGRFEEARTHLARLAELQPGNPEAHYLLGRVHADLGDAAAAEAALLRVLDIEPDNHNTRIVLARMLLFSRQPGKAAQHLPILEEALPSNADVAELQGLYALATDNVNDAIAHYRRAYELDPLPNRGAVLARTLWLGGQRSEAVDVLEAALEQGATPESRLQLAQFQHAIGAPEKAAEQYRKLLEDQPDNPVYLNDLAWMLREAGDVEAALREAERAYALAPTSPDILDTLGVILIDAGEPERALEILGEADTARPGDLSIQFHYAQALIAGGRNAQARPILQRLADAQDFAERRQAQDLLDRLQ